MTWELVGRDGRRHKVWHGMVAGRSYDVDCVINDSQVSRRHARFQVLPEGVIVHDLNSSNGSYVNGARFKNAARSLREGEQLRLGDSAFTLHRTFQHTGSRGPQLGSSPAPGPLPEPVQRPVYPPRPVNEAAYNVAPAYPPAAYPIAGAAPAAPAYAPNEASAANSAVQPRDWLTALLLCVFVGPLGIHRFYTGHTGMGILMLFTGGLFGIGWLIDLITIAAGTYRDAEGRPLVRR